MGVIFHVSDLRCQVRPALAVLTHVHTPGSDPVTPCAERVSSLYRRAANLLIFYQIYLHGAHSIPNRNIREAVILRNQMIASFLIIVFSNGLCVEAGWLYSSPYDLLCLNNLTDHSVHTHSHTDSLSLRTSRHLFVLV